MSSEVYKNYLASPENPCQWCRSGACREYALAGWRHHVLDTTRVNEKFVMCTALTESELLEQYSKRNERLSDLVRYQRGELHLAGLISDEEYAELAKDHAAVARLEGYDGIKQLLEQRTALVEYYKAQADNAHALIAKIQKIVLTAYPEERWADFDVLDQGVWKLSKDLEQRTTERNAWGRACKELRDANFRLAGELAALNNLGDALAEEDARLAEELEAARAALTDAITAMAEFEARALRHHQHREPLSLALDIRPMIDKILTALQPSEQEFSK